MIQSDFPELSQHFRTGTTGSTICNLRQIWKHGTARQQIVVPACMVSLGHPFKESRAEWLAQAVLIHLKLANYVSGEFFPYCPNLTWPGSVSQLDDIV